jgi:hypothetical protein
MTPLVCTDLPRITRVSRQERPRGLVAGTPVLTMEGILPVDFLVPGDLVQTASGDSRRIVSIRLAEAETLDLVRFAPHSGGRSGFGAGRELLLPAHQPVVLRDWRAKVVYGEDEILSPAAALVDGGKVTRGVWSGVRLFQLQLDRDDVMLVGGLEVVSVSAQCNPLGTRIH